VIRESLDWPNSETYDRQRPLTAHISGSPDAREGAAAFVEKRQPNWTGKAGAAS
jgi:enoyl-CoA hydratase